MFNKILCSELMRQCGRVFAIGLVTILSVGCSGVDKDVLKTPNYRKMDKSCSDLPLSSSTLSVSDFRRIVACLNSTNNKETGVISPVQRLVTSLTDAELKPLVDASNRYILNDKTKLYKFQKTFYTLNERMLGNVSILDASIAQLGKLADKTDLIINAIAILREGRVKGPNGKVPHPELMKAFEIISRELNYPAWANSLDFGRNITGAPAFQSFQGHFKKTRKGGLTAPQVVDILYAYLKEPHTFVCDGVPGTESEKRADLKMLFLQAASSPGNQFLEVIRNALGAAGPVNWRNQLDVNAKIRDKSAGMASIFQATLTADGDSTLLEKLSGAFGDLNTEIRCVQGSRSIPNAAMHIFREVSELQRPEDSIDYVLRSNRTNMVALAPTCTFPDGLREHYETLTRVVETGAMPSMAELMGLLYRQKGLTWKGCDGKLKDGQEYPLLAQLFIEFLADDGKGLNDTPDVMAMPGAKPIEGGFTKRFVPILKEVTARSAWVDLFLLAALPNDADQTHLQDAVKILTRPNPEIKGRSIAEVVIDVVTSTEIKFIYPFVNSLTKLMDSDEELLSPALATFRSAFHVNDVHPVLDLLQDTMSHATENIDFYNTLFLISEKPDFEPTLQLLAEMTKDGSLKELLDIVVRLFSRFAEDGKVAVNETTEPQLPVTIRHHLKWSDRVSNSSTVVDKVLTPVVAVPSEALTQKILSLTSTKDLRQIPGVFSFYSEDCKNLDPTFDWSDSRAPGYREKFTAFWKCKESYRADNSAAPPLFGTPGNFNQIYDKDYPERSLQNVVRFLTMARTESDPGKSFFDFGIGLNRDLFTFPVVGENAGQRAASKKYNQEQLNYLIESFLRADGDGRFDRLIDLLPLLVEVEYDSPAGKPGVPREPRTTVMDPLVDVIQLVMNGAKSSVQALEVLLSGILASDVAPKILEDVESLTDKDKLKAAAPKPYEDTKTLKAKAAAANGQVSDLVEQRLETNRWYDAKRKRTHDTTRETIKTWVRHKECAKFRNYYDPDDLDRALNERVQEIIDEVKYNATTWDLVSGERGSRNPRTEWELNELRHWLDPIFKKMAEPDGRRPGRLVLDSVLDFFKYFTLPSEPSNDPSNPFFSSNIHYTPDYFLNWYHERSIDYRLIVYFYPGEKYPRVRLVNTIDLFELVLYNVDFWQPVFKKNMGLDFVEEAAVAYGDVDRKYWPQDIQDRFPEADIRAYNHRPRSQWPRSIQKKYPYPKIMQTLKEAVEDIVDRPHVSMVEAPFVGGVDNLQDLAFKFVGLPELPECYTDFGDEDEPTPQLKPGWKNPGLIGGGLAVVAGEEERDEFRRNVFNLIQVNKVLIENAPDSDLANGVAPHVSELGRGLGHTLSGLEVIRDLYHVVETSTDPDENHRKSKKNNITMLLEGLRTGAMGKVARQLQYYKKPVETDDPSVKAEWQHLNDMFTATIHASNSPQMNGVMSTLLANTRDPNQELVWKVVQVVFDILAKEPDGSTKDPEGVAQMKQLAYYALPSLNRLEPWTPANPPLETLPENQRIPLDLVDLTLASTNTILFQYRDFLLKQEESLKDFLTWDKAAQMARVFYEDQDATQPERLRGLMKTILSNPLNGEPNTAPARQVMNIVQVLYSEPETGPTPESGKAKWKLLTNKLKAMQDTDEYRKRDIDGAIKPILHFLQEKPTATQLERDAAKNLRMNLVTKLQAKQMSEFLILIQKNPELMRQVFQTMSTAVGQDNSSPLKGFLKNFVIPSLSEKSHKR